MAGVPAHPDARARLPDLTGGLLTDYALRWMLHYTFTEANKGVLAVVVRSSCPEPSSAAVPGQAPWCSLMAADVQGLSPGDHGARMHFMSVLDEAYLASRGLLTLQTSRQALICEAVQATCAMGLGFVDAVGRIADRSGAVAGRAWCCQAGPRLRQPQAPAQGDRLLTSRPHHQCAGYTAMWLQPASVRAAVPGRVVEALLELAHAPQWQQQVCAASELLLLLLLLLLLKVCCSLHV